MPESALPPKREVATAILGNGSLFMHLDPRRDGVDVPAWLKEQPQLVLQVGLNMVIPIPDLHVDERGVSGTLSFSRSPFICHVPWDAVFALVGDDGRGMVWPESMPQEIASEVDREALRVKRAEDTKDTKDTPRAIAAPRRPSSSPQPLAAVQSHASGDGPQVASLIGTAPIAAKNVPSRAKATVTPKRRELPPYLRVVK